MIIDEFPYLIRSDPSLPSLMQRALDDQAGGGREQGARFLFSDAAGKAQIQVDVAVRTAGTPEDPGRVLSPGEAKWGEVLYA